MELGQEDKVDDGGRTPSHGDGDKELHRRLLDDGGDDDEGTRQPYNCTFCKRGFPTAQALGGHMNVHRKDRGRATSTPAVAASATAAARSACSYESTRVAFAHHPASGDEAAVGNHAERAPQELRLFGGHDGDRGKEGGGARSDRREYYYANYGDDHGEQDGDELDLELRLGAAGH